MAERSINQRPDDPGVGLSPEVKTFLNQLDREEIEILRRVINGVRSAFTVGKWAAYVVIGLIGLLVTFSQVPDAIRKIKAWLFVFALAVLFAGPVFAHDSWISRGSYKNPAGEWCCGADDCAVMISGTKKAVVGGYEVDGVFRYPGNASIPDERIREFWPYAEALPSPDGASWRCKRPDGSKRCTFVGPPGS